MIQQINESEKDRIRNLHREHFILNEQGYGHAGNANQYSWSRGLPKEGDRYMHKPPVILAPLADENGHYDFSDGTPEETRRVDIENNYFNVLTTENLMELSRFPKLSTLYVRGGEIESLPPEILGPDFERLVFMDVKFHNPLPINKILSLDKLGIFNVRGSSGHYADPSTVDFDAIAKGEWMDGDDIKTALKKKGLIYVDNNPTFPVMGGGGTPEEREERNQNLNRLLGQ